MSWVLVDGVASSLVAWNDADFDLRKMSRKRANSSCLLQRLRQRVREEKEKERMLVVCLENTWRSGATKDSSWSKTADGVTAARRRRT